jgi:hypothetical protein
MMGFFTEGFKSDFHPDKGDSGSADRDDQL